MCKILLDRNQNIILITVNLKSTVIVLSKLSLYLIILFLFDQAIVKEENNAEKIIWCTCYIWFFLCWSKSILGSAWNNNWMPIFEVDKLVYFLDKWESYCHFPLLEYNNHDVITFLPGIASITKLPREKLDEFLYWYAYFHLLTC